MIADQIACSREDLVIDKPLQDQGFDSLDKAVVVMEIEEEFEIDIPDADAEKLTTIEEIVCYIEQRCGVATQADDIDADPVFILWTWSGLVEEFACREDAERELTVMESRGCRGLIYNSREEAELDAK